MIMTNFAYSPYKKVTVKSYMKYDSPESLTQALTAGVPRGVVGKVGNLFWANGVVFKHYAYPATESVSKQHLLGHLPIDHIEYAIMPQYREEVRVGDVSLNLINVSNHTLFKELTKWITQKLDKKKSK